MTIHSDWAKTIKKRYPHCFSAQRFPSHGKPCDTPCGIIDGHIQLMGAHNVASWDQFLQYQFTRPIKQLFASGCRVVVLLFDNRLAVSPYKGMTQQKRVTRYESVQFSKSDQLPSVPPEKWLDHMMNRYFKDRVISFVCERVQRLIGPTREQSLVVDFKGEPKLYTSPTECPENIPGLSELGESDVKFARYVHMMGNSVVYATDGDYIPISLLYYCVHGVRDNNHISLFRQEANITGVAEPREDGDDVCVKRQKTGAGTIATCTVPKNSGTVTRKRKMEYIHMQATFDAIVDLTKAGVHGVDPNDAVLAFVSMMLLAGTDYSRGIPQVGPRRLIDMYPSLTPDTVRIVHGGHPQPSVMLHTLVKSIYQRAFANQLPKTPATTETLLACLQASKMAERTKKNLPTYHQLDTTCRNVAWYLLLSRIP
jgi:hypothetical protein